MTTDNFSGPAPSLTPRHVATFAICTLFLFLLGPGFILSFEPELKPPGDFFQDWASARNLIEGKPVYGNLRTAAGEYLGLDLTDKVVDGIVEVNGHPPTSIWWALPLARLDYRTAFFIWDLTSLALVIASVGLIGRELGVTKFGFALIAKGVALALLCNPLRQLLAQGQFGGVLLLLLTLGWIADRRDRGIFAGICVGLAAAIKLYPALIIGYWLISGRWSRVAAAVVTGVGIAAATVGVMGFESIETYVRDVMPGMKVWYDSGLNLSLTGFWHRLFHGPNSVFIPLVADERIAKLGVAVSSLVVLGIWGAIVVRTRRVPQHHQAGHDQAEADHARTDHACADHAWTVTIAAMTLISPLTWDHSLVVLALPLALAWRHADRDFLQRATLALVIIAFWLSPVIVWKLLLGARFGRTFLSPTESLTLFSFQFYAATVFFAVVARQAWQALAPKQAPRHMRTTQLPAFSSLTS
jgi:hypothetical protein